MKIKCVENRNESEWYLTVGKVYDMELAGVNKILPAGRVIDDTGDSIFVLVKHSGHGKFEVVEE